MKALVFLLVLANLLFYAYSEGHFGTPDNPDAARVAQQVAPDRMRIVARGEAPPVSGSPRGAVDAAGDGGAPAAPQDKPEARPPAPEVPVAAQSSAGSADSPTKTAAPFCVRLGPLTVGEGDKLQSALADKLADVELARQGGEGWWVHIPPLAEKVAAEKKAVELRGLGVSDYFVIQEGLSRYAISLGVFTSEKGGRERLAELKEKGVRSARLAPRPDKDGGLRFELQGPGMRRAALDTLLAATLPKQSLRDCR